jgi:hypothetical protein
MRQSFTSRDDRGRRSTAATVLACATIGAALFAAAPGIIEVIDYIRFSGAPGVTFVSRWALLVLWLSLLQTAYGVFLLLWPDSAAVWSVTISLLAQGAIYALTLGVILINGARGVPLADVGFQLAGSVTAGKAVLWCVCMVSLWTLMAFFAGRLALGWRRAETVAGRAPRHST